MNLMARWGRAERLPGDAVRLIVAWGVTSMSSGYLQVVRVIYLNLLGVTPVQIGLLLTVANISGTLRPALYGFLADRVGRKPILVLVYLSTFTSFLIYLLSTSYTLFLVASLIAGTGAVGYGGVVQQALLTEKVGDARRNTAFSLQFFGSSACAMLGNLLSGAPDFFQARFGLDAVSAVKPLFVIGILLVGVALVVIHPVQEAPRPTVPRQPHPQRGTGSPRSWRLAAKFSAYSMLAEFGAYIFLPLFSLWFYRTYQLDLRTVGYVYTASKAVGIFTYLLGPSLSERLGVVKTMVLLRMGGVLCISLLPFAPTPLVAALLYTGRNAIQHISVPLRQSYMMAVLRPEERASTAGVVQVASTLLRHGAPRRLPHAGGVDDAALLHLRHHPHRQQPPLLRLLRPDQTPRGETSTQRVATKLMHTEPHGVAVIPHDNDTQECSALGTPESGELDNCHYSGEVGTHEYSNRQKYSDTTSFRFF
jgi:MFS family permease